MIPTVSSPPPKLGSKELLSEDYLMSEFSLTGLASMSGCCQVKLLSHFLTHTNEHVHTLCD